MITGTVAITGSSGLVGSHVAEYLSEMGYHVLRFERKSTDDRFHEFRLGHRLEPSAFEGVNALIHCAYDFRATSEREIFQTNVRGSVELFETAYEAGVKKLVFISSVSAFEGCRSLYGKAKLETEKQLKSFNAFIIRPGLVYGDPERRGTFGALQKITRLPVFPVFDGGRQPMVLVHVDDLARFLFSIVRDESLPSGLTLTAANPTPIEFRDILSYLKDGRAHFISLPGRLGLFGLGFLETIGVRLGFRKDNLLGLLYPNPELAAEAAKTSDFDFRKF